MKISEVMTITGLTKKAINYYQESGLIKPTVDMDNDYRIYTEEDVETLKQISVLRNIGLSVKQIKEALEDPNKVRKIFTEYLNNIKLQISNMERCEKIIQLSLNDSKSENPNMKYVTDNLLLLKDSLDMSQRDREGYMQKELIRIFPGFFGRYISLKFSKYLDEPLDSKEKVNSWLHLVKVLDDSKDLQVRNEIYKSTEADNIDWNLVEKEIDSRDIEICSLNKEDIGNYLDHLSQLELTENELKWIETFLNYAGSKENVKYINNLIVMINDDMKILSSKYRTLQENLTKADENTKKEFEKLSEPDEKKVKETTGIVTLPEMTFIACEYKKIIPFWKIPDMINDFKKRVKEISNVINPDDIYTINGIDSLPQYKDKNHKLNFSFIIGVQVSKIEQVPGDMKVFTIPSHKYVWYSLKGKRNLNSFVKDEMPLVSFLTQAYKPVKFPLLELYNKDYCGHDDNSVFYNFMPID